jgi:hypothetical protein
MASHPVQSLPRTSNGMDQASLLRSIRLWLSLFILGLILSGITAFPLEHETGWLATIVERHRLLPDNISFWLNRVHEALHANSISYPFLAYGTDWLAFAHLVLATVFIGPWIDPVRNKWVLHFGVIACIAVLPLALIAGPIRGIPPLWRTIDCSFGVIGVIPLLICLNRVSRLERLR